MKRLSALAVSFLALLALPAHATISTIDPTSPAENSPRTSAQIRNQFLAAYNDINSLWAAIGGISNTPPGGSSGQIQWNNGGHFDGFTAGGDLTVNPATGIFTVTGSNGNPFGTAADANLGTFGASVPLNNTDNFFSGNVTFTKKLNVQLGANGDVLNASGANAGNHAYIAVHDDTSTANIGYTNGSSNLTLKLDGPVTTAHNILDDGTSGNLTVAGGAVVGAATGGQLGAGKVNATGLFVNGTVGKLLDQIFGATTNGVQLLNRTGAGTYTTVPQSVPTVLGTCALLDEFPNFPTDGEIQAGIDHQQWMLDCQKTAINLGAQASANLSMPACIEMVEPPTGANSAGAPISGVSLSTIIVQPRYTCWNPKNMFIRDGSAGTVASNWTGDPTAQPLANAYEPFVIMPPTAQLTGTLRIIANRVGTDAGSGFFYGRTWRVRTLTIDASNTGTGFVGGESCTMANGDTLSPSAGATFVVATASGGHAATLTFAPGRFDTQTGQFYMPPFQQAQQWAVANGWNGSDSRHPTVFNATGSYKTTCSGSGTALGVTPTWWPDWCDGTNGCSADTSYDGIFSNFKSSTGYINNVSVQQSDVKTSSLYGHTFGIGFDAFDLDANFLQAQGAYWGFYFTGSDFRVHHNNDVDNNIGMKIFSAGSFSIPDWTTDTALDHALEMDKATGWVISGHGIFTHGTTPTSTVASLQFGSDTSFSDATHENGDGQFTFGMQNLGSTSGIPAINCAFTRNTQFNVNVANLDRSGTAVPFQNTSFANFGSHCENSNVFTGMIDNVAGALFSGTNLGVGIQVWDATASGYALSAGRYSLTGSGAPTNGGSGTGAGKAGPGSTYTDIAAGVQYLNTNTAASPTWTSGGGGGSGTVNSGVAGQMGWYATSGTAISGNTNATISSGALTLGTAGTTQGSVNLSGSASGVLTVAAPTAAGTNTITLPAGTTDFTATGGTSQVVKQISTGAALTVGQLAASDLSNGTSGTGAVVLATSPSLTTPALGAATASSLASTGLVSAAALGIGTASVAGNLQISGGATAAAWGLSGLGVRQDAASYTDSSTAAGATVTNAMVNALAQPTVVATNATSGSKVTYTNAATLYIANAPAPGTNTLITTPLALSVGSGNTLLNGVVSIGTSVGSSNFNIGGANEPSMAFLGGRGSGASDAGDILFRNFSTTIASISGFTDTSNTTGSLFLQTGVTGTLTPRLIITSAGLVDIGTSQASPVVSWDTSGNYTSASGNITLTAGTFTGVGSGLTTLNASNLSSGTVGTARLGSGTASNVTYLRGDGTWSNVTPPGALTAGATVAWNVATTPSATLSPGANTAFTISNPTNIAAGGQYDIQITQPATGGPDVVTWGSVFKWIGATPFVLSTANNVIDVVTCKSYDGTNLQCVGSLNFQ